ncbi:hypothetical protein GQ53DRAFT_526172 [Thozetella sp. PMI_491]|nr:hypothetical protein GQ53DRAFT_526172 [Thozetella sp. PMI_491]
MPSYLLAVWQSASLSDTAQAEVCLLCSSRTEKCHFLLLRPTAVQAPGLLAAPCRGLKGCCAVHLLILSAWHGTIAPIPSYWCLSDASSPLAGARLAGSYSRATTKTRPPLAGAIPKLL